MKQKEEDFKSLLKESGYSSEAADNVWKWYFPSEERALQTSE
jgi:predicted Ser/Thr protein kinase